MRRMLIAGLCALALASAARHAEALDAAQERMIAEETARIEQSNGVVSRADGVLTLRAANGKAVTFRDEAQCGEGDQPLVYEHCVRYIYVDHKAGCRAFVVLSLAYEGYGHSWVDDSTGAVTHLKEEPRPSPSCTRVAVVAADETGGYNGAQIWMRPKGTLVLEWHREPTEYALYKFKGWQGEDTVRLTVTTWVDHKVVEGLRARVVRRQGQWTYEGPAEASR